jgi:hypothetical protein
MQTQIHCALVYAKATNASLGALSERMEAIETRLSSEQYQLLMPKTEDSATPPALELGGNL